jgi:autotransporter-associated beta strand protein
MAACAAVLGAPLAVSAAEVTWSGANANNSLWSTATNWLGNTAPVAHDSLVFDEFARLTPNNDFAAGTAFDGITFAASAGAFNLVGNQITLSGDINDNTPVLPETITLAMLLDGNRNMSVVDTGSLTIAGIISGNFGITKTGGGTLFLTAANSFTGTLGITAGVVSVAADTALGATTAGANRLVIDGGSLRSTANMTIASARGIALGNAGGGGGTFIVNSGTTLTWRRHLQQWRHRWPRNCTGQLTLSGLQLHRARPMSERHAAGTCRCGMPVTINLQLDIGSGRRYRWVGPE